MGLILELRTFENFGDRSKTWFEIDRDLQKHLDKWIRVVSEGCKRAQGTSRGNRGFGCEVTLITNSSIEQLNSEDRGKKEKKSVVTEFELFSNGVFWAPRGKGKLGKIDLLSAEFFPVCILLKISQEVATLNPEKFTKVFSKVRSDWGYDDDSE